MRTTADGVIVAADFEGITQLQLHVRLKSKPEEIVRTSADPFNLSRALSEFRECAQ